MQKRNIFKKRGKSRLKAHKLKVAAKTFTRMIFAIEIIVCVALWGLVFDFVKIINILDQPAEAYITQVIKVDTRDVNISYIIEDSVDEFLPNHKSESLMIMHCLAHRESGHGASNAHGDNGMAGGPFQFWEDTWIRMRNQMIKQGYADEIGSRYDLKESIRTTTWAIKNGNAKEWGPILRDSNGSDYASCQTPSWY